MGGGANIPRALNFKKSAHVKNLKYSRWIPLNQAKINALWNVFSLTSKLRSIGNFSNIVDFIHLRQTTLWNSTFWQILVCTVLFEIISHWASLDRSISHAEGKAISLSCAKLGFGHFFSTGWLLKTNYLSDNIMGLEKVMRERIGKKYNTNRYIAYLAKYYLVLTYVQNRTPLTYKIDMKVQCIRLLFRISIFPEVLQRLTYPLALFFFLLFSS